MKTADNTPDPLAPLTDHAALFKALSDPVRLSMIAKLATLPTAATVSELSNCCGIDFSGVSRHLKILKEANILEAQRDGRHVLYCLNSDMLTQHLRSIADTLDCCIDARS